MVRTRLCAAAVLETVSSFAVGVVELNINRDPAEANTAASRVLRPPTFAATRQIGESLHRSSCIVPARSVNDVQMKLHRLTLRRRSRVIARRHGHILVPSPGNDPA